MHVYDFSTKTSLMGGKIVLANNENETLDKFAVSNAMALSVHLGAYESLLNDYIDSMLPVTEVSILWFLFKI